MADSDQAGGEPWGGREERWMWPALAVRWYAGTR
ncbi:hypothetical protein SAMN04489712_102639 [Thermomonospora echinospora]|uniref:Uncharacterized protein n=1 Tax=Thermomonospora echinospora TaxID=1992 RepID=A0A1H5WAD4_9ACTN|nr:hypothetical protein SAMN04489712_102639 [Thermomonospora echinospora]